MRLYGCMWILGIKKKKKKGQTTLRGNAVAVTPQHALTALHGLIAENTVVELVDTCGKKRKATVIISRFENMRVDMVLLQLNTWEPLFEYFIEICREPVRLGQDIALIGLVPNSEDISTLCFEACKVTVIDSGAIFHSNYVARDGLSGSAIIVSLDNNSFRVVGVHVAAHDDTVSTPPPISQELDGGLALASEVEDSTSSLASSLHGHMAFCLICEVARVPEILSAL